MKNNLNQNLALYEYQVDAFQRFIYYTEKDPEKKTPIYLLYNMAKGSEKTLIMAGLILYPYKQGYRNFIFFVKSNNIIEKILRIVNGIGSKKQFSSIGYSLKWK